ncbi:universal stress protein [Rufibacter sediminis]|uniref:Universal stress protein n=1 Tax=Rufibacter sediminis TaxID=2762756 RepID=A0ABR6VM58_9BACT|nr:universal stress protein [Rufibacter sediminis]MBC3538304.1 universal stress protein [Rufibacter sediminis]
MIDLVVLTDFSTAADNALHYAVSLAKKVPTTIKLVHIWQHSILDANYFVEAAPYSKYFEDKFPISSSEEQEAALQRRCDEFGNELTIEPVLLTGSMAGQLAAYLQSLNNPLVVIGKCYTEDIPDEMVDSTSLHLLKLEKLSLLVVPEVIKVHAFPRQLVIGLDGKKFAFPSTILNEMVEALQPVVQVVHVSAEMNEHRATHINQLINKQLSFATDKLETKWVSDANVVAGLSRYLQENKGDILLSLVSRKRSFIEKLFHESTIAQFIRHATYPLLILPG